MRFEASSHRTIGMIALFCLALLVYFLAMHARLGDEMADDAAFLMRYAENMQKGKLWVWNNGEAPVWGASAPLYPLLVAAPMALGVPPTTALIGTGIALSAASLTAVTLLLASHFSLAAGLAFLAFSALDSHPMYFASAGLETPLTYALLALGGNYRTHLRALFQSVAHA